MWVSVLESESPELRPAAKRWTLTNAAAREK